MPMQQPPLKCQQQGASSSRGALHIKPEPYDDVQPTILATSPAQPESRQLLKQSILRKRKARGEEVIEVNFDETPVKHELSPDELERKERRKEQNRRAAKRCRQKKKLLQVDITQSYDSICKENKSLEKEIQVLKQQRRALEQVLNEHLQSGKCQLQCVETEPANGASMPVSAASFLNSPIPLVPHVLTSPTATSAAQINSASSEFAINKYLQDIGPIEPADTFMDLGNLGNLESEEKAVPSPVPVEPQCSMIDTLKVLEDLTPVSSMCLAEFLSPVSPAGDRHSSVSSEWSSVSDQSRGFCADGYYREFPDQRLSTSELDGRGRGRERLIGEDMNLEQSFYNQGMPAMFPAEDEADDDEVFSDWSATIPSEELFRSYMH